MIRTFSSKILCLITSYFPGTPLFEIQRCTFFMARSAVVLKIILAVGNKDYLSIAIKIHGSLNNSSGRVLRNQVGLPR